MTSSPVDLDLDLLLCLGLAVFADLDLDTEVFAPPNGVDVRRTLACRAWDVHHLTRSLDLGPALGDMPTRR